jgi:hypothetical protein
MSTATAPRASTTTSAGADVDLVDLVGTDLVGDIAADLVADIDRYLAARRRTAHPLVTATTEELVRAALAELGDRIGRIDQDDQHTAACAPQLPRGLWRVLPDRLLALHPGRATERSTRRHVTVAEHLELTALVLERWGWAKTPTGWRTPTGRRCILGAQAAVFRLGYGTEDTVAAAGAHLNAALRARGIRETYPRWNDQPNVSRDQVLALVRDAATTARR